MQKTQQPSFTTSDNAIDALKAFDLTNDDIDDLVQVLQEVDAQVRGSHPKGTRGTRYWHEAVSTLREKLLTHGWLPVDHKNQPRVMKQLTNGQSLSLTVSSGDKNTGTNNTPKTKNLKGSSTKRGIDYNQLTLDLEHNLPTIGAKDKDITGFWILLVHHDESNEEIRLELSKPNNYIKGQVTSWQDRIILPCYKLNQDIEFSIGEYDNFVNDAIDIPVNPKAKNE